MILCGSSQRGAHPCREERLKQLNGIKRFTVKHQRVGVTENVITFLFALHFFAISLYWKILIASRLPPPIPKTPPPVPKTRWRNAFGSRELRYNLKRFPGATLLLRWLWWRALILAIRKLCFDKWQDETSSSLLFTGKDELAQRNYLPWHRWTLFSYVFHSKPVLLGSETLVPPVYYLSCSIPWPCWEKCQRVTTRKTTIGSNGDVRRSLCNF